VTRLLLAACILVATPSWAQRIEVAPLTVAAFTTSATIDPTAAGISDLEIASSFTYGAQAAFGISPHMSIEGWWNWRDTSIRLERSGVRTTLFYIDASQIGGNLAYAFGDPARRVRPFIFGGGGVSLMSSSDIDTDVRFLWDIGAGVKWFMATHVGIRGDARYQQIHLGTDGSDFCAPFAFCQRALSPMQVSSALLFRF